MAFCYVNLVKFVEVIRFIRGKSWGSAVCSDLFELRLIPSRKIIVNCQSSLEEAVDMHLQSYTRWKCAFIIQVV